MSASRSQPAASAAAMRGALRCSWPSFAGSARPGPAASKQAWIGDEIGWLARACALSSAESILPSGSDSDSATRARRGGVLDNVSCVFKGLHKTSGSKFPGSSAEVSRKFGASSREVSDKFGGLPPSSSVSARLLLRNPSHRRSLFSTASKRARMRFQTRRSTPRCLQIFVGLSAKRPPFS
jgi:hypothetical protein